VFETGAETGMDGQDGFALSEPDTHAAVDQEILDAVLVEQAGVEWTYRCVERRRVSTRTSWVLLPLTIVRRLSTSIRRSRSNLMIYVQYATQSATT
jgi:predicted trehalose synthase